MNGSFLRACCEPIRGSVADAALAGLSAEPETIEELQNAVSRFIKPVEDFRP
jgi:CO/xanthine dehydrogenase FAD-binding subunit